MSNLPKIALLVLITGIICIIATPVLFTRSGFLQAFMDTGQIGDTIGGITAPISSLVGSVLVFLALKSQIEANKITQDQIQDQHNQEQIKKEVLNVTDLYKFFLNNLRAYETKYYKGHRAIMQVMRLLAESERKQAHDENRLYYGTAAELYSLLKLGKLFLDQVNKSRMDLHDKAYFKGLVKHHYEVFIIPYIANNHVKPHCSICGEMHSSIPFKILTVIEETIDLLSGSPT